MTSILGLPLPTGWSSSPLKYVTTVLNRGTAPVYVDDGPVRAVSQGANQPSGLDWSRTRFHAFSGDPRKLKGYLQPGDVIINSTGTGTLGRVGQFTGSPDGTPCVADGHVTVARADLRELHPRFSYYWLLSRPFQEYVFAALVVGATNQIELNRERLGEAPVPLPPLEEQRRIADFLDAETARIDRLSAVMRSQDELLSNRRSAVLATTWQSGCPLVRLGYFLSLVTSGPRGWGEYVGDEGRMFFRSANLRRDSIEPNLGSVAHVAPPDSALVESFRSSVRLGDVLVGITGANAGWVCLAGEDIEGANVSQHVCLIRPSRYVSGTWLAYLLSSPAVQDSLLGSQYGGTKTQLSLPDLRNLNVPMPELSEQEAVADEIRLHIGAIESERGARGRQLTLLTERRQALITAAVTGQLDVTTARPAHDRDL
ncbi:restriction endonuclease subunit S [Streptomyces sp. NRRL F-4489]|uniref:restriction endonuclease subunit S n=1 Tax=Streptomyces sp. NRRL F-4489 TaxID=1609095 RepID=UPI00099E59D7|nr:restriction endonuclease subunit S [Streptomyces sp. NRRL F-4489]